MHKNDDNCYNGWQKEFGGNDNERFGNRNGKANHSIQIGGTSWEPEMPHTGIIIGSMKEIEQIEDVELRALKYFCYIARTQMFIDGNKRVAQLMANKVLIENDIGIFQIPIEKLEKFKGMLIEFYETGNDVKMIGFMKEYCIRRVRI